jgi:GNAT superfamily N-acetyltransferase
MSTKVSVSVRRANEADLGQVLALFHEFHEFHVRGVPDRLRIPHPYDDAAARDTLHGILHNVDAALIVAEEHRRLVGLAEVYLRHDTPHPAAIEYTYGYLQSLIVTASLRRSGLGRQLVAAAEQWSHEHGATEMRLACWEFADGPLPFYEALGYRTMKRTLVRSLG